MYVPDRKILTSNQLKKRVFLIYFFFVAYILFSFSSMVLYPDGVVPTGINFGNYQFWRHFISDLGMVYTFGGILNDLSRNLLFFSLVSFSSFLSVFYITFYQFLSQQVLLEENLDQKQKKKIYLKSSLIFGLTGDGLLILVAIFPKDTMVIEHQITTMLFFISTIIALAMIVFTLLLPKESIGKKPRNNLKFVGMTFIFWLAITVYAIFPIIFPVFQANNSYFKPTLQKITVISLLAAILNLSLIFLPKKC